MRKFINLKLFRKFLVLAVLSGSLFIISSNRVAALPCCDPLFEACDSAYFICTDSCDFHFPYNPARHAQCIGLCEDDYFDCYADAEPCDPYCR